jgi:hypothetical protein
MYKIFQNKAENILFTNNNELTYNICHYISLYVKGL